MSSSKRRADDLQKSIQENAKKCKSLTNFFGYVYKELKFFWNVLYAQFLPPFN